MSWFILGLIESETLDMYSPLVVQEMGVYIKYDGNFLAFFDPLPPL